jgi:DNA-directed RNA polymerase subunit M/transcription elongation factor TFIIS
MSLPLKERNPAPKSRRNETRIVEKDPSDEKTMRTLLRGIMFTPGKGAEAESREERLFTDENIKNLLELKLPNGSDFFDFKSELAYEFIGGCEKTRRDGGSITLLIEDTRRELEDANNTYRYSYIDRAPWYGKEEIAYQEEIKRLKIKIAVKKGIFPCPVCQGAGRGAFNTNTVEIQVRSGDEPPSNFNDCNTCGHKWRIG